VRPLQYNDVLLSFGLILAFSSQTKPKQVRNGSKK
jgi:hypothetical protein